MRARRRGRRRPDSCAPVWCIEWRCGLKSFSLLNALSIRQRRLVEALVEAKRVLSVGVVWNDRVDSALVDFLAQSIAVISRVAEHMVGWRHSADQALGNRVVVRLTAGQQNGEEASLASASACIFALRPPRERPTACFCSPLMDAPPLLLSW